MANRFGSGRRPDWWSYSPAGSITGFTPTPATELASPSHSTPWSRPQEYFAPLHLYLELLKKQPAMQILWSSAEVSAALVMAAVIVLAPAGRGQDTQTAASLEDEVREIRSENGAMRQQ